ncbi:MAG: hypothetical protein EOO12_06310 [Chitinophagaceae bacterium]|nr:MAG: hypothetical protein EOO12_06310 [Chitinophagaceae bacterium]
MQDVDIDKLVQQAATSGSAEDLKQLWKAALDLEQWHFITKVREQLQDRKPFIGVIDDKPWVFVFTDRQKAQSYGSMPQNKGFVDSSGSALIISMETDKAIGYLLELANAGVYGVRFNEGNGWFAPLGNLPAVIAYVRQ